jgi:hypothetical protein
VVPERSAQDRQASLFLAFLIQCSRGSLLPDLSHQWARLLIGHDRALAALVSPLTSVVTSAKTPLKQHRLSRPIHQLEEATLSKSSARAGQRSFD